MRNIATFDWKEKFKIKLTLSGLNRDCVHGQANEPYTVYTKKTEEINNVIEKNNMIGKI